MAARSKAQVLLEKLQEREYRRLGTLDGQQQRARDFLKSEDARRLIEETVKKRSPFMPAEEIEALRNHFIEVQARQAEAELPTRYENPVTYPLMLRLAKQVEEAAAELGRSIPIRPQLGTLPTGQVNAMAVQVPASDEYLVLFESGLFTFALLLSKAVVRAMPFANKEDGQITFTLEEDDVARGLREHPETFRRFREVLVAYLVEGSPSAAPRYLLEEPYMTLASFLIESMELFVIAHEYGHISRGHLSASAPAPIQVEGEQGNEITRDWQQEFEADMMGLELMVRAMQKKRLDLALSYWGADFFFSCIELVEQGLSILRTGEGRPPNSASDSHPPVELRREFLRELLRKSLPEGAAEPPIKLGTMLEKVIEALWAETEPVLQRLRAEGLRPSPIWG